MRDRESVSLVSERERSNFKVTRRSLSLSLSLSLCFGCFRFEMEGLSPVSPSFPGRRSRSSSSASRLPLSPGPSHCPPLPSPINCLSHRPPRRHLRSWLSWLSWLANRYPQFLVRGFGGGVKQKKDIIFFSGGGEGARARVCGAVRPRVQERDPFDPKP